jgi:hypothetical protein
VLFRIAMRNDLGANRMKPLVAIGVIEVPMRVHEMSNRAGAQISKGFRQLGSGHGNARVDEDFAVRPGQDRDIPAGAFQYANVVPQLIGRNARGCRAVFDQARASANAWRGVGPPPAAAKLVPARQQKQKPRRDIIGLCGVIMWNSSIE